MSAGPIDLAYDVAGASTPVLLLHGLFASGANWREVAVGLAATHRVCGNSALAHWMIPRVAAGHAYVDVRSNLGASAVSLRELCAFPLHRRHLSTALPLHAIAGGRSDWVQPLGAASFQPMFPNARVEVIDGAGHWVHADRPRALLASLRRFLAPVPRRLAATAA